MIDSIVNFILIFMTCSIDVRIPTVHALFVGGIPGPGVVGYVSCKTDRGLQDPIVWFWPKGAGSCLQMLSLSKT